MTRALVIRNAAQLASNTGTGAARGRQLGQLRLVPDAAVAIQDGTIAWIGPSAELPAPFAHAEVIDAAGKTIVPGFIDSHTHAIFAGDRSAEFEQRLQGRTYQEITAAGGGINATVTPVRQASKSELRWLARRRLAQMLAFGVTTVEIKSGYGLTLADEIKCLEVIADLKEEGPQDLIATFLGAHVVPSEYRNNRAAYIRLLIDQMLPEVARSQLARFCDVFCETDVFSIDESAEILGKARDLGLGLKVHADELTTLGGAELAVRLGAVSADHLLCISDAGIDVLARSDTVATLLPGTAFFLGMPYAPARKLIERGAAVALASDCNPGTCPTENLPLVGAMACAQMRMLPAEALTAMTLNAAAALGVADRLGTLEPGKQADLLICDIPDYRHLFYHFGVNHVWRVLKRGRVVHAT